MNISSYGEWLDADLEEAPELVKGLIPSTSCGFFAGVPKCGKTWGVLDLALAVLSGQPFLGRPAQQIDRPVMYVAGEGGIIKLLQRIRWLSAGRDLSMSFLRDRLHLSIAPRILLDRSDGFAALEQSVKDLNPGLVIIDPLTRFHTADENSRTQIDAPILTPLRQLSEEYETCVMVVHHSPKYNGGRFDPLRGTSAFQGWYDFLLYYEPVTSDGKKEGDSDDEIDGFRFCASLRDNEEPPKRDIFVEIDSMKEMAKIRVTPEGSKVVLPPSKNLPDRITYLLKTEHSLTLTKMRKILKRNRDQVEDALDLLLKSKKVGKYTENGVTFFRLP